MPDPMNISPLHGRGPTRITPQQLDAYAEGADERLARLAYRQGRLAVLNVPCEIDHRGYWGVEAGWICEAAAVMAERPDVERVLVDIHSPGGSAWGGSDLVDAVSSLARVKPVTAFAHDLMASQAYLAFCTATEIVCTASADVGSIGSLCGLYDDSANASEHGVRERIQTTATHKKVGWYGVELTPEMLEVQRAWIGRHGADFVAVVAESRGLEPAAIEAWQGRVFHGEEAVAVGLVDRVVTTRELWAELTAES